MSDDLAAFLDAASQQAVSLRLGHPCSCPYCDKPTPASRRDLNAADALAVLVAGWRKVLALHKPWRIYDECDHDHAEDDPARVDCGDFTSCEASFMYEVCHECCQDGGYMTEACADGETHGPDMPRCRTIAALVEALSPTPTPTAEETQ